MKLNLNWLSLFVFAFAAFAFTACDDDEQPTPTPTITAFVQDNANFSILFEAVDRAGLGATLADENAALTVFAPTNAAFEAFLAANNFNSLENILVDLLTNVLLGHVVGAEVRSTDLTNGYVGTLATFDGQVDENINVYVDITSGVSINGGINVTAADEIVANGIIHVIDAVIVPADVVTLAVANPNFSSLVAALTRSDLQTDFVEILTGAGPFTVFAPTNDAFQALLDSNEDWNTLADIPVATLELVLSYHVASGANVRAGDLSNGQTVNTVANETFTIDLSGSTPAINAGSNRANIIATDVQGSNGVVHAIDTVILP